MNNQPSNYPNNKKVIRYKAVKSLETQETNKDNHNAEYLAMLNKSRKEIHNGKYITISNQQLEIWANE